MEPGEIRYFIKQFFKSNHALHGSYAYAKHATKKTIDTAKQKTLNKLKCVWYIHRCVFRFAVLIQRLLVTQKKRTHTRHTLLNTARAWATHYCSTRFRTRARRCGIISASFLRPLRATNNVVCGIFLIPFFFFRLPPFQNACFCGVHMYSWIYMLHKNKRNKNNKQNRTHRTLRVSYPSPCIKSR